MDDSLFRPPQDLQGMAQIIMSFRKRRLDREGFPERMDCGLGLPETRQGKAKVVVRFGRFFIGIYRLPKQSLSVLEIILLQSQDAQSVKHIKSTWITAKQAEIDMFGLAYPTRSLQRGCLLKQICKSGRSWPNRRRSHERVLTAKLSALAQPSCRAARTYLTILWINWSTARPAQKFRRKPAPPWTVLPTGVGPTVPLTNRSPTKFLVNLNPTRAPSSAQC